MSVYSLSCSLVVCCSLPLLGCAVLSHSLGVLFSPTPWVCRSLALLESAVLSHSLGLPFSPTPWVCCSLPLLESAVLSHSLSVLFSHTPWFCCSLPLLECAVLSNSLSVLFSPTPWVCCPLPLHRCALLSHSLGLPFSPTPWACCSLPFLECAVLSILSAYPFTAYTIYNILQHPPINVFYWCFRLLHVRNANCKYTEADTTWKDAQIFIEKLELHGHHVNKAALYSECCALLFAKSLYDEAFKYCCRALQELHTTLPPKVWDTVCTLAKSH